MLKKILRKTVDLLGLDKAIGFTVLARVTGMIMMPVTLLLIVEFLTPQEQGYYYTFGSLLGLTMFFDLGLSNVLLLFASHEKPHLNWDAGGVLVGDQEAEARVSYLLRIGLKWFGAAGVLMIVVLFPVGLYFFWSQDPSGVGWRIPWFAAVVVAAGRIVLAPVLSILEGCGKINELRLLGFINSLICSPVMWLVLFMGGGLFACPVLWGTGLIVTLCWLFVTHPRFVVNLLRTTSVKPPVSRREIWALQWRTALGWLSGYFAFQLFSPMLFAFHGSVIAGQMGMSLSLAMAVNALGLAWVGTKTPRMGGLWSGQEYSKLNSLFASALWRSVVVTILGGLVMIIGLLFLRYIGHKYADRLLEPLPFLCILATQPLYVVMMSEQFCLRANKKDPLVWFAVLYGCMVLASNLMFGQRFGPLGMAGGYFCVTFICCIVFNIFFFKYLRLWQKPDVCDQEP